MEGCWVLYSLVGFSSSYSPFLPRVELVGVEGPWKLLWVCPMGPGEIPALSLSQTALASIGESGGESILSHLAGASNSSVSCCQGRQDVTSSRWASDQWTPSLGKDVGPGQDEERWLMDGPGSCDGWAGRSCHLSWEVSDFESGRREGMGSWEGGGGAAKCSRAGEVRARAPRLGRGKRKCSCLSWSFPALDQRMLMVR